MAILPHKPEVFSSFWKCLDGPEREHWRQAAFTQYTKNAKVGLFSQPFPRHKVPKSKKILQTVLAPKVKSKGNDLYEFVARMCANGSKQQKGVDFDFSWSPVIGAKAFRMTLSWAAINRLTLAIMDVVNCFQSTLIPEEERIVVTLPSFYMDWFKKEYPEYKLEDSPSGYVLQAQKGLQGDKHIGRKWYLLIKKLFAKFGLFPCPQEPALYLYQKDDTYMLVNTSTDDFLCAYSHDSIFRRLETFLSDFFGLTCKTGNQLSYLNIRIYQSSAGISFDQTDHIQVLSIISSLLSLLRA